MLTAVAINMQQLMLQMLQHSFAAIFKVISDFTLRASCSQPPAMHSGSLHIFDFKKARRVILTSVTYGNKNGCLEYLPHKINGTQNITQCHTLSVSVRFTLL